ncbi:hypothetical protein EF294_05580 [Gordonia oryzae]|uniref:Uncharacterized protein n=1 Tax=Gordonia oryzae TaxID=2487349 RepID=A0A3N4GQS7_9ACTN|nr:hypothetical protein EF294_05580 [Gordonia oryzae]
MSAINYSVDCARRPDLDGDRVVVTFDEKFSVIAGSRTRGHARPGAGLRITATPEFVHPGVATAPLRLSGYAGESRNDHRCHGAAAPEPPPAPRTPPS